MHKLITWDWKDQPPLKEILEAARDMVDMDCGYDFQFYLPETDGDYYACVLSRQTLSPEEIDDILFSED